MACLNFCVIFCWKVYVDIIRTLALRRVKGVLKLLSCTSLNVNTTAERCFHVLQSCIYCCCLCRMWCCLVSVHSRLCLLHRQWQQSQCQLLQLPRYQQLCPLLWVIIFFLASSHLVWRTWCLNWHGRVMPLLVILRIVSSVMAVLDNYLFLSLQCLCMLEDSSRCDETCLICRIL